MDKEQVQSDYILKRLESTEQELTNLRNLQYQLVAIFIAVLVGFWGFLGIVIANFIPLYEYNWIFYTIIIGIIVTEIVFLIWRDFTHQISGKIPDYLIQKIKLREDLLKLIDSNNQFSTNLASDVRNDVRNFKQEIPSYVKDIDRFICWFFWGFLIVGIALILFSVPFTLASPSTVFTTNHNLFAVFDYRDAASVNSLPIINSNISGYCIYNASTNIVYSNCTWIFVTTYSLNWMKIGINGLFLLVFICILIASLMKNEISEWISKQVEIIRKCLLR